MELKSKITEIKDLLVRPKRFEQAKQRKPKDQSLEIIQSDEKKKKCVKANHCISNHAEESQKNRESSRMDV